MLVFLEVLGWLEGKTNLVYYAVESASCSQHLKSQERMHEYKKVTD